MVRLTELNKKKKKIKVEIPTKLSKPKCEPEKLTMRAKKIEEKAQQFWGGHNEKCAP